jgi:hypothetical protein
MYQNWSFRLLIYTITLTIVITIILLNTIEPLGTKTDFTVERNLLILGITSTLTFCAGIICLIISFLKKEDKNYKFYVSLVGFTFFMLFSIINFFI